MMRQPISVSHDRHSYQVIFRLRGLVTNWSIYVEAETPEHAIDEARLKLAYDRYRYVEDMASRPTSDADWVVAEVNAL